MNSYKSPFKKYLYLLICSIMSFSFILANISYSLADKFPSDGLIFADVNVRKNASERAVKIFKLKQGEIVKILASQGKYYKIEKNGKTGYVLKEFMKMGTEPSPTPPPSKYTELKYKSDGYAVLALQEALQELKFYNGELDGKFGKSTESAIIAFQKMNKMKASGKASTDMQELLYEGRPKDAKKISRKIKTLAPIPGITINYGNRGQAVADLQTRLKELNYYGAEITRIFDVKTRYALNKFQKNNGIKKGLGSATPETQAILFNSLAIPADASPVPQATPSPKMPDKKLQKGDNGKQVENLQSMLKTMGYLKTPIDGKYGKSTLNAIKAFQKKNSLKVDGIAGKATIEKIFSETAIYADGSQRQNQTQTSTAVAGHLETVFNIPNKTVKEGDSGDEVLEIQKRLNLLGYYNSRLDGKFLADDRAALMAFQSANALNVDGIANQETINLLFADNYNNANANVATQSISLSLRLGDTGENVKNLQKKLIELKYLDGTADGIFKDSTKKAVLKFQAKNGLKRDGIAGASTLEKLYASTKINEDTKSETLKKGDKNKAVIDIQKMLINLGYLDGKADGNFGNNTYLAVLEFQAKNGLKRDGIVGGNTLKALQNNNKKATDNNQNSGSINLEAPSLSNVPYASEVQYADWYTQVRQIARSYPNVTVYDYSNGLSWQLKIFSTGSHADAQPNTLEDTQRMVQAFGGINTWKPKPVWVQFSNGQVYMATIHDMPHGTFSNKTNGFDGHLCIHFPRSLAQVQAIGPYATAHQNAVDIGWKQTQLLVQRR